MRISQHGHAIGILPRKGRRARSRAGTGSARGSRASKSEPS